MNKAIPEALKKVVLLLGGNAAEREISLKSGSAVLPALQKTGLEIVSLDPADEGFAQRLQQENPDKVFIALHGVGGEDGMIQGFLQTLGYSYTGSGVMASALAMDKLKTKQVWYAAGLPTPGFEILDEKCDWNAAISRLGGEAMVKPAHEGSSLGMSKVTSAKELESAWKHAAQFDALVLAESWVHGPEYTVAVLGEQALPPIELRTPHDFYDFDAKYQATDTQYLCPCDLSDDEKQELTELAMQAFVAIGCSGWGRVDVMRDSKTGRFLLLEVNTIPGMTDHSLVPMAAAEAGISFDELVLEILLQEQKT